MRKSIKSIFIKGKLGSLFNVYGGLITIDKYVKV